MALGRLSWREEGAAQLRRFAWQINGGNVYLSPFTLRGYPAAAPYGQQRLREGRCSSYSSCLAPAQILQTLKAQRGWAFGQNRTQEPGRERAASSVRQHPRHRACRRSAVLRGFSKKLFQNLTRCVLCKGVAGDEIVFHVQLRDAYGNLLPDVPAA